MKDKNKPKYRSAASRKQSHARRVAWLGWRGQQPLALPDDRLWLLYQLVSTAFTCAGKLSRVFETSACAQAFASGRNREIFPLPQPLDRDLLPSTWTTQRWNVMRSFVNAVIGTLNWCYGVKNPAQGTARPTVAKNVRQRLVDRCIEFHDRVRQPARGTWEGLVPDWVPIPERPTGPKYGSLCADSVDVLPQAGRCNPVRCLPPHVQNMNGVML